MSIGTTAHACEWHKRRLGWLGRLGNGSTPNRGDDRYWADEPGFPWLNSSLINEGVIRRSDYFVTKTALSECHLPWVPSGSVLIAITGEGQTRGRAALLEIDAAISQHLVAMTPTSAIEPRYLRRFLESRYEWLRTESSGVGSTRAALTCEFLRQVQVPVPPLWLQRRIADFLDRKTAVIDDLIAKKERLVALLAERRQAIITQALTKGIDPTVPTRDSGVSAIGWIPAHWRVTRLMHLTPAARPIMYGIVLPGPHVDGGIPIVKSGDCWPEKLKLERLSRTTPEIEAPYARARLEPRDIVYAIRGSVGTSALVPDELRGANLTQDAARIAPGHGVDPSWLLLVLQARSTWTQLEAGILGATVKGINIRDLKRPYVAVPPIAEQTSIATSVMKRTAQLLAIEEKTAGSVATLREYRQTLITAAVTGQLDVQQGAA